MIRWRPKSLVSTRRGDIACLYLLVRMPKTLQTSSSFVITAISGDERQLCRQIEQDIHRMTNTMHTQHEMGIREIMLLTPTPLFPKIKPQT